MAGSSLFFLNSYETCCVYVTMAPQYKEFDLKLTSDVNIRQLFKKTGGEDLFLPLVTLYVQFFCSDWSEIRFRMASFSLYTLLDA